MSDIDDQFVYRIEEAKFSLRFLFWWHWFRLRSRLRRHPGTNPQKFP